MSELIIEEKPNSNQFVKDWRPVGARILVRKDPTETEKLSSIIAFTDDTKKKDAQRTVFGVVISMGDQCYNLPSQRTKYGAQSDWCKVGDRVLFGQYAGSSIIKKGCEDLVLINDEDILMVENNNG